MVSYEEALTRIYAQARLQACEHIAVADSLYRICAESVISQENLPPFDNTAMDGYALSVGERGLAAGEELDVSGRQAAGDAHSALHYGAMEIMTGARMPDGADTVIPVEQISVLKQSDDGRAERIRINESVASRQHVRRAGEDVRIGDEVLTPGCRISDRHLMLLSAIGAITVGVREQIRASILCTGAELVSDPRQVLASGEIRNSNGPYLAAALPEMNVRVDQLQHINDDVDEFVAACKVAMEHGNRLIVSTGAVSMGAFDFVPEALSRLGAKTQFHKVQIRPGKPILFATLPNGALFFGLPGNPVSTAVGLRFFVEPAVRAMYGLPEEKCLSLPLLNDARKKADFRFFQKARVELADNGGLAVRLLKGQESFRIQPFVDCNAWLELPEGRADFETGESVRVYGWRAGRFELR